MMKPCKHLDYTEGKYGPDITLQTCAPHFPEVRFWLRGPTWTDNGPGQKPNPSKVQFCGQGRGRINGIFDCYQAPGPMGCYEESDAAVAVGVSLVGEAPHYEGEGTGRVPRGES